MNATIQEHLINVREDISSREILCRFQFVTNRINRAPLRRMGDGFTIKVGLVSLGIPRLLYSALQEVGNLEGRRFLTPLELLMLDYEMPTLQFRYPIITPQFVLGVGPLKLYEEPGRSRHGRALSSTESFESLPVESFARFATAECTDVDLGTFEEVLEYL